MLHPELAHLYSRLQMSGINVEIRDVEDTEEEEYLRLVIATPFQLIESRVYSPTRGRYVTLYSLSYDSSVDPRADPNRRLRLIGSECWTALTLITQYANGDLNSASSVTVEAVRVSEVKETPNDASS